MFAVLTALVVRKAEGLQSSVEGHYSALTERTSDALGNVPLVQSSNITPKERASSGDESLQWSFRRSARFLSRLLARARPLKAAASA